MTAPANHRDTDRPAPLAGTAIVCAAVLGLAASAAGWWLRPDSFWPAYLCTVIDWLGVTLGCLGIALLHRITGGRWGFAAARELHAGIAMLPLVVAATAGLFFGAARLFPWADPSRFEHLNPHQQEYFSGVMLSGRLIGILAVWGVLGAWSLVTYRRHVDGRGTVWDAKIAAAGLLLFFILTSFAVIDGIMALSPGWTSSLYGLLRIIGFSVSAMAAVLALRGLLTPPGEVPEVDRERSHDLGNLLQAFNMMWAYLAFSQYLIIWSGDLPQEVSWYADRRTPAGAATSLALFGLHFALPFCLLLSRPLKRDPRRLALVAALLLVMQSVDHAWNVLPSLAVVGAETVPLLAAISLGIGGTWFLLVLGFRRRLTQPLPELIGDEESHAAEHHAAPLEVSR